MQCAEETMSNNTIAANVTDEFYAAGDDAIAGYGGQFMIGDGASPEAFEAVAGVVKINLPAQTSTDVKTTHLRSPNRHEEHRAGMRDTPAFTVELVWLPYHRSQSLAGGGSGAFADGGLAAMAADGLPRNMRFVANDGSPATTLDLRGYVATFAPGEINKDGTIPATATIQPTQAPTLPA
jgi:hypothetical protein